MNKKRRTTIIEISQQIKLSKEKLEDVLSEEQESYENMPENLQNSNRGMESEDAQGYLESTIELLEEAIFTLEDID